MVLTDQDYQLIAEIQGGLPLVSHPYAAVGEQIGLTEEQVMERVTAMQESGIIKRLGLVVRHHELGYKANAMVVWNIPDDQVDAIGDMLGQQPCTTLCYQRPRHMPEWPYNLFTMIHGKERQRVLDTIESLTHLPGMEGITYKVLFSGRRFKQRGARYQ